MGRLLYLENSAGADRVAQVVERFRRAGFDVESWPAHRDVFPDDLGGYDGVFVSGSPHGAYEDVPWIHREHELLQAVVARGIPTLGVCFGSQILASALCGRDQVFRRTSCEVGYAWLDTVDEARDDPLMRGLDKRVRMFVWHNDEVRAAHPSMQVLAWTDDCPNHIWRLRGHNVWGVQGHPEVTRVTARDWLDRNRAVLSKDGADVEALVGDPGITGLAEQMFGNFLEVVHEHESLPDA
jgi:GMP synthase (glutamine-hydrolysing)